MKAAPIKIFIVLAALSILMASCSNKAIETVTALPSPEPSLTPTTTSNPPTETLPPPTEEKSTPPFIEEGPCARTDLGGRYSIDCGTLYVLENREKPDGRVLQLPFIRVHSPATDPSPTPLIYIAGGGGFTIFPLLSFYMDSFGEAFLARGDLIFTIPRGAPGANPELQCPGFEELLYDLSKDPQASAEEIISTKAQFLGDCAGRLRSEGVELEMYSSTTDAADLSDLVVALGLDRADFLAQSYGTNVGFALLRDHPEVVRSMVMDSVLPPQVHLNGDRAPNAYNGLETLFTACSDSPECNQAYPNLREEFYALAQRLDEDPVPTQVTGWETQITGGIFTEAILTLLYTGNGDSGPRAIMQASAGDFSRVERYIPDILNAIEPSGPDLVSEGVFYSITCREWVPFDSLEAAREAAEDLPAPIGRHIFTNFALWQFTLCDSMGITPADELVSQPVISDIPVLLLSGGFDIITPPEYTQLALEGLENGFSFVFPGEGHGLIDSVACAREVALSFLENPFQEPEEECFQSFPSPQFK
jgi:pimeloyl-ACP methyl ester carboxylesterase